jgi:hypothetical protein
MADKLALINLYDLVTAAYVAESDTTPHFFGWKQPPRQREARARILWVPGTPEGEIGEITAPKLIHEYPARALANIQEQFHVYIHGFDPDAAPEDDRAHYIAVRFAFDTWFRHVYNSVHGTFSLGRARYNPGSRPQEFRHGATILVGGTIQAVIPDAQVDEVNPVDGQLSLQMLDETETVTIDNEATP